MIISISATLGEPVEIPVAGLQSGEALDISLTVVDGNGAEVALTGLNLSLHISDDTGENILHSDIAGAATGPYRWHFHGTTVSGWNAWRKYMVWLSNPDALTEANELLPQDAHDSVALTKPSLLRIRGSVGNTPPVRYYYGAGAAGLTASQIEALGHVDGSTSGVTVTVAPTAQYCYLAWLSTLDTPTITVDGLNVDTDLTAATSMSMHAIDGSVTTYTMRRTTLPLTSASLPFVLEF